MALQNFFESLNLFSIESNGLESLDVNAADQYTFSRLKYKTVDQIVLDAMKQSIKKAIQSTKILDNYAECRICEFNSNSNLLYTRHVPISIYNKYKVSD